MASGHVICMAVAVLVGLVYLEYARAVASEHGWVGAMHEQQQQQDTVCKGLGRKPVDWWVMLKHPSGYQYSYLDSSMLGNSSRAGACLGGTCWRHGLSMLNPNPVAHTLAPLAAAAAAATAPAAAATEPAYLVYNDEEPAGIEHFDFAHAKGVAAVSSMRSSSRCSNSSFVGFWMIHSAPRFPKAPTAPGFDQLARAQSVFGQHFSCFTLAGRPAISAVAELLLTAGPYIYSSSLPAAVAAAFPAWQQLLEGRNDTHQRSLAISFQTAAQQQVQGFAKSKELAALLTDEVVGPGLGVNMLWETWRRSHDALPSKCTEGKGMVDSINIQQVAFPSSRYRWPWSADHSKWGVSVDGSSISTSGWLGAGSGDAGSIGNVVCIGDMNRAAWQVHRGGGYVCMQHAGLWQAFSSIVAAVEPCT